jgi:hypothetical protein
VMANWSSSSNPDFDLYLIDPAGNQVAAAEGVARQETVSFNPTTTGDYTIRVSSWTGSGSYWLDASYAGTPPPPDTTAPAQPTGLSATPGDRSVALQWTANGEPDLHGYRVYRNGETTPIAAPTTNSYTDTGLTNGAAYSYRVTAVDRSGNESTAAGPVSATPVAPPTVKNYNAAGFGPTIGNVYNGRNSLSRLNSDDGSRVEYSAVLSGGTYRSEIQPWTTITSAERAALKKLTIRFNGGVSSSSVQHTVSVKNQDSGQWEAFLGPVSGTTSDRSATFTTSTSPTRYVSAAGQIRIRVTGTRSSSGWRTRTDWVRFTIEY